MKYLFILLVNIAIVFPGFSQETRKEFTAVDESPEPIEGEKIYMEWIKQNTIVLKEKYHIKCQDNDTTIIVIGFIIDKNGNVTNPKVLKGISTNINNEALNLVSSMKIEWKPGKYKGQNVSTAFYAPFNFCLVETLSKKNKKKNKKHDTPID